jgi:hypothetical protein
MAHLNSLSMNNGSLSTSQNYSMDTFNNSHHANMLLQSYGQWIHEHMAHRWNGYLFSFMFDQLQGSDHGRMEEMKKQLGWFYGRLAKASVPKASSPKWSPFLPKAALVPDFPVFKHSKQRLSVRMNNRLHWHGLVLATWLAPKLRESLDVHIKEDLGKYLVGNIRRIDIKPITHDVEYVTGYGMKSLKSSRVSGDDILIFPRSVSELLSRITHFEGQVIGLFDGLPAATSRAL